MKPSNHCCIHLTNENQVHEDSRGCRVCLTCSIEVGICVIRFRVAIKPHPIVRGDLS